MTVTFRRAPDFERRSDMIEATLDCIAETGIRAATVRALAARAGVSSGLIRHHFASKDNLILAAYRRIIEMITRPALDVLESADGTPHRRLARFVVASLSEPVADPRMLSLWATFISQIHVDPQIAAMHRENYVSFRKATEPLIGELLAAEGRGTDAGERERLAIAINALLDGLWLEGCLSPQDMPERERIEIGLRSVEALLGVKLPHVADKGPSRDEDN